MLDAYGAAADRFIDWTDDRWRARRPPRAGRRARRRPILLARRSRRSSRHSKARHVRPDRRPDPARPARDQPADRGGPRRIARGPRRPRRRRGAARDPGGRPAPGPGRGRGHDADARATRRSWRSGSCGPRACSTARRCSATSGGDPGTLSQPDDTIVVRLSRPFDDSKVAERHFVATASCGICGKASIDEVALRVEPLPEGPVVARSVILALPGPAARRAARLRRDRRAPRGRACSRPSGELIAMREDVGRHNALDKLVGSQVLAGAMPLHDRILMVSGRVSFEIVQKAAVAGIPIVCAVSAPSDLAIETAERLGVTLVGFLRGDGFNVYAHDARIDLRDLSGLG